MFRWLDEFFHPAKACARLGHEMIVRKRRVYLWPAEAYHAVADVAEEQFEHCTRCGLETSPPKIRKRSGIQGLSMPTHLWDRLKEEGRLER